MRLSQGHLKLLEDCPRKFQHAVLEHLEAVTSPEQQYAMTLGKQFHQCVEQWSLGLAIPILNETPLDRWWKAFEQIQSAFGSNGVGHSEFEQTLPWHHHLLGGIYDLLLLGENSAEILDWKTYGKPRDVDRLAEDWQTRLYLFLLAEATGFDPENLAMTYWFLGGTQAESWRIVYNRSQHRATELDLQKCLEPLSNWLDSYQKSRLPFPQISEQQNRCGDCRFNRRCDRLTLPSEIQSLTAIPEVTLTVTGPKLEP
jgi:hypothetical protein